MCTVSLISGFNDASTTIVKFEIYFNWSPKTNFCVADFSWPCSYLMQVRKGRRPSAQWNLVMQWLWSAHWANHGAFRPLVASMNALHCLKTCRNLDQDWHRFPTRTRSWITSLYWILKRFYWNDCRGTLMCTSRFSREFTLGATLSKWLRGATSRFSLSWDFLTLMGINWPRCRAISSNKTKTSNGLSYQEMLWPLSDRTCCKTWECCNGLISTTADALTSPQRNRKKWQSYAVKSLKTAQWQLKTILLKNKPNKDLTIAWTPKKMKLTINSNDPIVSIKNLQFYWLLMNPTSNKSSAAARSIEFCFN